MSRMVTFVAWRVPRRAPIEAVRSLDMLRSMRVCQNAGTPSFYKRSPDFPKPGLCHIKVFL